MTTTGGSPPDTPADAERRREIGAELSRIEESAKYSAQSQLEQAKQWRLVNLGLGVPTSVFAAISAAMVVAPDEYDLIAAGLALLAAAGGAVLTTLNAAHRMNQASSAGNAYLEIQGRARQARLVDLPYQDIDDARSKLEELTARRDEQNKTAEIPNRRAYRKGKNIEIDRGQDYDVDNEKG